MFLKAPKEQKDNAPISIIITTLAAHAYSNENSIFETLSGILVNMHSYVEIRDGKYWIANPAMPAENFADKWEVEPRQRVEFMRWLNQAREEIIATPSTISGMHNICEAMEESFGVNIVRKSFAELGHEIKASRDDGNLFISGLTGGLTTTATMNTKKVGGHTFFGK